MYLQRERVRIQVLAGFLLFFHCLSFKEVALKTVPSLFRFETVSNISFPVEDADKYSQFSKHNHDDITSIIDIGGWTSLNEDKDQYIYCAVLHKLSEEPKPFLWKIKTVRFLSLVDQVELPPLQNQQPNYTIIDYSNEWLFVGYSEDVLSGFNILKIATDSMSIVSSTSITPPDNPSGVSSVPQYTSLPTTHVISLPALQSLLVLTSSNLDVSQQSPTLPFRSRSKLVRVAVEEDMTPYPYNTQVDYLESGLGIQFIDVENLLSIPTLENSGLLYLLGYGLDNHPDNINLQLIQVDFSQSPIQFRPPLELPFPFYLKSSPSSAPASPSTSSSIINDNDDNSRSTFACALDSDTIVYCHSNMTCFMVHIEQYLNWQRIVASHRGNETLPVAQNGIEMLQLDEVARLDSEQTIKELRCSLDYIYISSSLLVPRHDRKRPSCLVFRIPRYTFASPETVGVVESWPSSHVKGLVPAVDNHYEHFREVVFGFENSRLLKIGTSSHDSLAKQKSIAWKFGP